MVIKASEFGLATGPEIYGYSLIGHDVNPSTANDLLAVTNTTIYPTNTADASGDIDLAAVNGLELRLVVPEPSTWTLLGISAVSVSVVALRRRRPGV